MVEDRHDTVTFEWLTGAGFVATHTITQVRGRLDFKPKGRVSRDRSPSVYLWVVHADGARQGEVLYVGKAEQGIAIRCAEHRGGFTSGPTGIDNARRLRKILAAGHSVTVMTRRAAITEMFGREVSLHAAEESALLAKFAPRLNRATVPDVEEAAAQPAGTLQRICARLNSRLRDQEEGTAGNLAVHIEAYGPEARVRLDRLLTFIEERLLTPDHDAKLVGRYSDQPPGCNNVTTLVYGRLVRMKFSRNSWIARVYFTAKGPCVAFPRVMCAPRAGVPVEVHRNILVPHDIDAFLEDPGSVLLPDALQPARP